jgi:hypothetical protein
MFESVSKILNHFIKIDGRDIWRFDIYSIHTERGENPEDLYYLCNVRDSWYIIFETDYIHSLAEAAKEAAEIFESDSAKITHWVTKRNAQGNEGKLPLEAGQGRAGHDKLVLAIEGTYLCCAMLSVNVRNS